MPGSLIVGLVTAFETVGTAAAVGAAELGAAVGLPSAVLPALSGLVSGGVVGAGLGAGEAAIMGGDPLKGAEFGGITGGALGGFGPGIEAATGLSKGIVDPLLGAGAGALGGIATGQGAGAGALQGGVAGLISGGDIKLPHTGGSAGGAGGAGASAAATAPPPGIGLNVDATQALPGLDTSVTGGGGGSFSGPSSIPSTVGTSALPGDIGSGAAAGGASGVSGLPSPTTGAFSGSGALDTGFKSFAPTGDALSAAGPSLTSGAADGVTGAASAATGAAPAATAAAGKNPVVPLLLASSLLRGNKQPAYSGNLSGQAGILAAQGNQLTNYELSGTLPPGVQGNLTAAGDAAKASIRSQYASRGMSGSSAEAQDLAATDLRIQGQGQQYAAQLFQQGLADSQMSSRLYQLLMNQAIQQDQQLGAGISNLVGAMALMGHGA